MGTPDIDERRSAALLLEGAGGGEPPLDHLLPAVARAVRSRPVPGVMLRYTQRLAMKRGGLGYERDSLEPMVRARRAALGDAGAGPPGCWCGSTSSRAPEATTGGTP